MIAPQERVARRPAIHIVNGSSRMAELNAAVGDWIADHAEALCIGFVVVAIVLGIVLYNVWLAMRTLPLDLR